jgi:exosortase
MATSVLTAGPKQTVRHLPIFALCLITLLAFWPSLKAALSLALHDDRYLQIMLAPLMCAFLIFRERSAIFSRARYSPRYGIPLLSLTILVAVVFVYGNPGPGTGVPRAVLAVLSVWLAAFVLCYGVGSLRAALYPFCCLLLTIPFPPTWMDRISAGLQNGSADVSYAILRLSGIPIFRHELVFSLPGLDFEVGPECSGIRSSLALMMVALIAGYVYLRSAWARSALMLLTVPIALFKNAVRIVVISILGAYVDRIFINGPLHHRYGGLVFSTLGTVLFVMVLAGLQGLERRLSSPSLPPQDFPLREKAHPFIRIIRALSFR